jgi:hypothetical protein
LGFTGTADEKGGKNLVVKGWYMANDDGYQWLMMVNHHLVGG